MTLKLPYCYLKSFIELIWIIQEKSLILHYQIKTNNNYGNNDNSRD